MEFEGFYLQIYGKSLIHFIEWIEFYELVQQKIHWNKLNQFSLFRC